MSRKLRILHLYHDLLDIYGDRGNVIALTQRARWHGYDPEIVKASVGTPVDFEAIDIVCIGGGQDKEQAILCDDFVRIKGQAFARAIEGGLVVLAICGSYQLMGHYYQPHQGTRLEGIGIFDLYTEASYDRMIGNIATSSDMDGQPRTLVGFENHSGKTYLGPGARPLGKVLAGHGNNGKDKVEGAIYRNAFGSYCHGALLPKNPWLADTLIERALNRRFGEATLRKLDDRIEENAHQAILQRLAL